MLSTPLYAQVLLPLNINTTYTYLVPNQFKNYCLIGQRVIVEIGKNKLYTGVIVSISEQNNDVYAIKEIIDFLDHENNQTLFKPQFQLIDWISSYYLCSVGEVFKAMMPTGLSIEYNAKFQLHPDLYEMENISVDKSEQLILGALYENDFLSIEEIQTILNRKNIIPELNRLLSKEYLIVQQDIKEKFVLKKKKKIKLHHDFLNEEKLEQLINDLESKTKQQEVILQYLTQTKLLNKKTLIDTGLDYSEFKSKNISLSSLNTLVKNGVFVEFHEIQNRIEFENFTSPKESILLSTEQNHSLEKIKEFWQTKDVVLLKGITGSGKTEIYFQLIEEQLLNNKQVLLLLPEIALSTQIIKRVEKHFGKCFGVFHSKSTDHEKSETWKALASHKINFIIGVRSSVFLPFTNLGLIIVDEEHDNSFKQQEPNPRFNARDCAIMMGQFHHCKILLGSSTPSIESYHNAIQQKWGLVELQKRYFSNIPPTFKLVGKSNSGNQSSFRDTMLHEIKLRLEQKEQVIIFQNRRGYASFVQCEDCDHIPFCKNCNVTLTYHQYTNTLQCHYCSHTITKPKNCPSCHSLSLKTIGTGTEKIEDELAITFKNAQIGRMDFDTTRSKYAYDSIIEDFSTQKTQILVGTQMITKGLNFNNVTLVAILDTDRMYFYPDFRSKEYIFQTLTQVSGRAGRNNSPSLVLIESELPESTLFQWVKNYDYKSFYENEIHERKQFFYPPFSRLIKIHLKNKDRSKNLQSAKKLKEYLSNYNADFLTIGPQEPAINRVRNLYITTLLIKIPRNTKMNENKKIIQSMCEKLQKEKAYRIDRLIIDVDPR